MSLESYFGVGIGASFPDKCRGMSMASATAAGLKDYDRGIVVVRELEVALPLTQSLSLSQKMPSSRSLPKNFLWGFATGVSPNCRLLTLYR